MKANKKMTAAAAVMAAITSLTVTAGAIGYSDDFQAVAPPAPETKPAADENKGSEDSQAPAAADAPTDEIKISDKVDEEGFADVVVKDLPDAQFNVVAADMEEAISSGEAIVVKAEKSNITAKAVLMIAKAKEPVTFVSSKCEITIDPKTVKKAKAVNLGMDIKASKTGEIAVIPASKTDYGMELQVTIPKDIVGNTNMNGAKVVYIDKNGKEVEVGEAVVNKDGSVTIVFSKASNGCKYVIRPQG